MKGYVYIQQILPAVDPRAAEGGSSGESSGKVTNFALANSVIASQPLWISRYLVSFPYCGLKWFRDEPIHDSFNRLLTDNSTGGWVFGGSVQLTGYVIEEPIMHGDIFIYPFVIEIAKGNSITRIRLAVEDQPTRLLWVDDLQHSIHYQNYLYSCKECNALPRHAIAAALEDGARDLSICNIRLNSSALGSIVMYSRIVGVDGCVLQKLHLENAQIADRHVPLICAFLTFTHFLESLSLHGNYLSCTGVIELADTMPSNRNLTELILSNNFIADKGACAIAEACRALKRLKVFDIARNRLSAQSTKALALYLARYDSEITHLNFSFNKLGDSVASLVCLLLTNPTAKLESVDLSYCGLTEVGVDELAAAIPQSQSLNFLRLVGNSVQNGKALGRLIEAVHEHFTKYRKLIRLMKEVRLEPSNVPQIADLGQDDPLLIEFGGVSLDPHLGSMSLKTLRTAISYMTDITVVDELILRRRVLLEPKDSAALQSDATAATAKLNLKERHLMLQEEANKNEALRCPDGICCVRVQFSRTITDAYEVLDALSRCLRVDRRQFVLVSTTMSDDWNSCFVTFSIVEPASEDAKPTPIAKNTYVHGLLMKSASEQMRLEGAESISVQFSSPRIIFDHICSMCKISDPKIRRIGITSAFIYIPPSDASNGTSGTTYQYQISPSSASSAKLEVSSSTGAHEVVDFLPPFFPIAANHSSVMNNEGDNDDSDEDDDVVDSRGKKGGKRRIPATDDNELEDIDDGDSASVMTAGRVMMEELDKRMTTALVKGYEEAAVLDNLSCHFWQGVFGVEKWKKTVTQIIKSPLSSTGSFVSVEFRKRICDAMYRRDWNLLASLFEISKRDGIPGGMAILLGDKLYSEIASIRHESEALSSIACTSNDIFEVESFLLHCATLGYMGPETFAAIERREQLVRLLVSEKKDNYEKQLHRIKMRALITNAMISRDMEEVHRVVEKYSSFTKIEPDGVLDEVKAAKMLVDYNRECTKNLRYALELGTLEAVENAIASAAYHNLYIQPHVDEGAKRLDVISGNYSCILDDLTVAIRFGDQEALDRSVFEIRRIGYSQSPLSSMTISKIFALRNRLFQVLAVFIIFLQVDSITEEILFAFLGRSTARSSH
jgi:Ran GTPase-activating protein (RanGAP) involved in mRNA processing and transport